MGVATGGKCTRGADLLVESLIDAGIEVIFGVPGDTGVIFYDALYDHTNAIQHVLARDERHAGAMADAYARVSNRVGVVEVSSGGGTTYVVGGLGEAFASGVPVLVITSDIDSSSLNTGALTEIDQLALFSAVTKWRHVASRADEIPALVREALSQAISGRPGPVALILPENVLSELVDVSSSVREERIISSFRAPAARVEAQGEDIRSAAHLLSRALHPAILAGSGVHVSEAWSALADLAEHVGIPVATSIHGKGVIPDSNPWSLGVAGNNGGRSTANAYLQEADVVLLVGTRANATDTNSWTAPRRSGVSVIQIDIDVDRAGRNFPESLALVGDARTVLEQLRQAMRPLPSEDRERRRTEVADAYQRWASETPVGNSAVAAGEILPADVIRVLNQVLGSGTVVVADPGTPTPNVASYWETKSAGRSVIVPRGHGPMGYAIPGAIGASFARPEEIIISLTADGSFAMACGELETASRYDLPILYVQFTNNSMGWIKMLQHLYFGQRYFGVDPGPIDAVGVASSCGVRAERVDSVSKFRELVEDFRLDPHPLYIDMQVPHMIDYTPPVSSWLDALQGHGVRPVY